MSTSGEGIVHGPKEGNWGWWGRARGRSRARSFPHSRWRERAETCSRHPRGAQSQTPEKASRAPSSRPGPQRSHPGVRPPCPHKAPARAGPRAAACTPPSPSPTPHRNSPRASSSATAAAQEAAPHARRAAALRRALQPGEARASAEQGPSSPGATGPRQRGGRRPPHAQPASSHRPRPAGPHARPAPLTCSLHGRCRPRRSSPWPRGSRPRSPPGRSLRLPSALRELSRVAVATRTRRKEPASKRRRCGSQSLLRSSCPQSPSRPRPASREGSTGSPPQLAGGEG